MRLWKALNEPFPDESNPKKLLLTASCVSLFVAAFLYFFQPFGIHHYPKSKLPICLGFGLVTFFSAIIVEIFLTHILRIEKDLPSWTLLKWILESLGTILFIAAGNLMFASYFFGSNNWDMMSFFQMIQATLMVGIFPIVFSGLWSQLKAKKKHIAEADKIQTESLKLSNSPTPLVISSQNEKHQIQVYAHQFYFAEAMQNYVNLYYSKEEKIKKEVIRNTVANIEKSFVDTNVIRCHRSYLVNIDMIEKIDGNAQGLRLKLKNLVEVTVPVSRKYISTLKEKFE